MPKSLQKGEEDTGLVYKIAMPATKIAVIGVAMNESDLGDGAWVLKLPVENIAGLPYEIHIVDNTIYHLFVRYRIALGGPGVKMGESPKIGSTPEEIASMLTVVSRGKPTEMDSLGG